MLFGQRHIDLGQPAQRVPRPCVLLAGSVKGVKQKRVLDMANTLENPVYEWAYSLADIGEYAEGDSYEIITEICDGITLTIGSIAETEVVIPQNGTCAFHAVEDLFRHLDVKEFDPGNWIDLIRSVFDQLHRE